MGKPCVKMLWLNIMIKPWLNIMVKPKLNLINNSNN